MKRPNFPAPARTLADFAEDAAVSVGGVLEFVEPDEWSGDVAWLLDRLREFNEGVRVGRLPAFEDRYCSQ